MTIRHTLFTLLSGLLTLFVLFAPASAKTPALIARVADWPPAYWQQDGQWQGMNVDFYRALATESGLSLGFSSLPWSRGLESIKSGECTIMAEVSKTEDRASAMHFLGPYAFEEMVLVVHKDDLGVVIDNLQMLITQSRARGLQIGIERDAYYGPEFNLRLEKDPAFRANFEFARTTLADMIGKRRLFAFIEQRHIAAYKIRTIPEFADLAIHPFTINRAPLYLAVTKTVAPDTLARLQQAVTKLNDDGTFAAIESKWKTH